MCRRDLINLEVKKQTFKKVHIFNSRWSRLSIKLKVRNTLTRMCKDCSDNRDERSVNLPRKFSTIVHGGKFPLCWKKKTVFLEPKRPIVMVDFLEDNRAFV